MVTHYTFHHELINLNKKLLKMSAMVEDRVRKAITVIKTRDQDLIQSLIMSDYEVDEMEVEVEEDCLKILALHQPVAGDLRFIITVIKVNSEIERIADIAVNIAMRVQGIANSKHKVPSAFDYSFMSEKVITMLKMSLDALVNRDAAMARQVFHIDDEVDAIRNTAYEKVKDMIRKYPEHPGQLINTYLLARHLERIGDRATNIAEEVIYLVEGSIVRCP
jgi:phosphate transport system protein